MIPMNRLALTILLLATPPIAASDLLQRGDIVVVGFGPASGGR
jgi:hypothetical protein